MNLTFRTLKAEEIECRVGQIKAEGFSLLIYKDARCDMDILDETVGAMNWRRSHSRDNANCTVFIWDSEKKEWVGKEDTGTESNTEKEKGLASDSFKRACVNWGIGRELYTAPKIAIKGHTKQLKNGKLAPDFWNIRVSEIEYNESREISKLVIIGDDEVIYTYKSGKPQSKPAGTQTTVKSSTTSQKTATSEFNCSNCGVEIPKVVKEYSEKNYGKALCRECQKSAKKAPEDPVFEEEKLPWE